MQSPSVFISSKDSSSLPLSPCELLAPSENTGLADTGTSTIPCTTKLIHTSQTIHLPQGQGLKAKKPKNWTWLNKKLDAQKRIQDVYFEFWMSIWRILETGLKYFIFQILYPQGLILFHYYWYCLTTQLLSHGELWTVSFDSNSQEFSYFSIFCLCFYNRLAHIIQISFPSLPPHFIHKNVL